LPPSSIGNPSFAGRCPKGAGGRNRPKATISAIATDLTEHASSKELETDGGTTPGDRPTRRGIRGDGSSRIDLRRHQGDQEARLRPQLLAGPRHQPRPPRTDLDSPESDHAPRGPGQDRQARPV